MSSDQAPLGRIRRPRVRPAPGTTVCRRSSDTLRALCRQMQLVKIKLHRQSHASWPLDLVPPPIQEPVPVVPVVFVVLSVAAVVVVTFLLRLSLTQGFPFRLTSIQYHVFPRRCRHTS